MLIGEGERKIMIPKKHAMQLEKITKLMNHSKGDSVKDGAPSSFMNCSGRLAILRIVR